MKFRAWVDELNYYAYNIQERANMDGWFGHPTFHVEQYTGLKDKNGKEIYEGDIVGFKWTKRLYVVVYRKYDASFILENDEWEETIHLSLDKDDFEVFGNKHENPELLDNICATNKEDE